MAMQAGSVLQNAAKPAVHLRRNCIQSSGDIFADPFPLGPGGRFEDQLSRLKVRFQVFDS